MITISVWVTGVANTIVGIPGVSLGISLGISGRLSLAIVSIVMQTVVGVHMAVGVGSVAVGVGGVVSSISSIGVGVSGIVRVPRVGLGISLSISLSGSLSLFY